MADTAGSIDVPARRIKRHRPPRENEAKATKVYVIASERGCKVGISSKPKRRLSSLQGATPDKLRLHFEGLPTTRSALAVEQEALALLKPWRVVGEWHSCKPEFATIIVKALASDEQSITEFVALFIKMKKAGDVWYAADVADAPTEERMALFDKMNAVADELLQRFHEWSVAADAWLYAHDKLSRRSKVGRAAVLATP